MFGNVPIADVTASQVIEVLDPIWYDKPETAKRVLQRMEAVFKSAILRGAREKASPCIGVAQELRTRSREVRHRAALPWQEVRSFVAMLQQSPQRGWPSTRLAFEFLILTATRSSDMTFTKLLRDVGLGERATAHGFRSSFKNWCSEVKKVADEVSEAALAHSIKDRVKAAYLRTDFFEERRSLMEAWAGHCQFGRASGSSRELHISVADQAA